MQAGVPAADAFAARRRHRVILVLLAGLAACAVIVARAPAATATTAACRDARIMTWNLYLGADLRPALAPQTLDDLLRASTRVAAEVVATDFPTRAKSIADAVAASPPDLIGLQEAVIWRTGPTTVPQTPAARVQYDFVASLLRELAARGLRYAPAAAVSNADIQVPTLLGLDIRLTDRDVILMRADLPAGTLSINQTLSGNFDAALPIPNDFIRDAKVTRGWVAVDAELQGCPFRLVSTHLEGGDGPAALYQFLQAQELLGPTDPTVAPRVVLVGDFNSRADGTGTPTYGFLRSQGFADAWSQVRTDAGLTCCHDVQALLRNPFDRLTSRIDLVLTRGMAGATSARRTGVSLAEWARRGIWPADHAGVATTIRLR